ncbi:MAG: hypothetical protein ACI898_001808, partial [Flavobacteriales bacterium]
VCGKRASIFLLRKSYFGLFGFARSGTVKSLW